MRVAFFSHSAGLYGAERSLLDLVLGLKKSGIHPVVILPTYGDLVDALNEHNIQSIIFMHYGWIGRRYKMIKGTYRYLFNRLAVNFLTSRLSNEGFDLVYSNTIYSPMGALVARSLNIKHILHIREFVHEDMGADFDYGTSYATKFVANTSSYLVYNSYAVRTKFEPFFVDVPSVVIYNGWLAGKPPCSTNREMLTHKKTIKLCIVGSVHRGKGQHKAIEALSILKRNFPNITLNIVGTGDISYIRELKELCSARQVSSCVNWFGFSNNVAEIFRQSDIALVCSENEAFGRVVVESMAEGCPVVGSDSGGIPEIIIQGKNGLMYDGSFEDLARQVCILINDPELYTLIVKEGIIDVYNRFGHKNYVGQVRHLLERVSGNEDY